MTFLTDSLTLAARSPNTNSFIEDHDHSMNEFQYQNRPFIEYALDSNGVGEEILLNHAQIVTEKQT